MIKISDFTEDQAIDVSNMIIKNLLEVNIKDYCQTEMYELMYSFTAEELIKLSKDRKIFVATSETKVVGTISVSSIENSKDDYALLTIFVLPEYHGQGIGKRLVEIAENYIKSLGGKRITIQSSITAHLFYRKMGYSYKDNINKPNKEGFYIMVKEI